MMKFQLWTMYCEQVNRGHDPEALVAIMDFWARITPGILHLLSHSKVVRRVHRFSFDQCSRRKNESKLSSDY